MNEVKEIDAVSLIVDGTQDISVHEQLSFCIRYIDKDFNIKERFLGFWDTSNTDAESLFTIIGQILEHLNCHFPCCVDNAMMVLQI